MIVKRGRRVTACGHHWHAVENGWQCCGCPDKVRRAAAPPDPGTAVCRAGPSDESMELWLAPEHPPSHRPAGRRTTRFPYRRLRAL